MTTSVGIVGFRGYSGAELVRILARHPHVEPVLLEHRSDSDERPRPRKAGAASAHRRDRRSRSRPKASRSCSWPRRTKSPWS